jgi:methyl-accepting chemotaxis protein
MTDFLRRFSQVGRVRVGFAFLSIAVLGIGFASAWLLRSSDSTASLVLASIAGVVGALGLTGGWLVSVSIKAPVDDTAEAVKRIADGDLETKVESPGRDELSWLRHELNAMRKKLRGAVVTVKQSTLSVSNATREIAGGNGDLSSRTEQQAAALEHTAASLNQIAETVRASADYTRNARDEIGKARDVAERSGSTMLEAVSRMADIQTSAARISEIIGVIDGIAFQTNILALNAAVEAARAGDHGRGFAVVAAEVRNLAQRCAGAAREVKSLIGESNDKVDAGSKLVGDAGKTMEELLTRVQRAASQVDEIAAASGSQSGSLDRVNQAMKQIEGMTQQNAALVEQVAAAAGSLDDQAQRLSEAVAVFSVRV